MKRDQVNSGIVVSAAYDKKDHVAEIELKGGKVYRYHGVSPADWEGFENASSKGAYFNSVIKPHHSTLAE